jgi:hypothetical protein
MMTQSEKPAAPVDHAGDYLRRKQVRPTHYAASLASLGSIADQFDVLFDFIQRDQSNDFTSQYVLNQATRHGRH